MRRVILFCLLATTAIQLTRFSGAAEPTEKTRIVPNASSGHRHSLRDFEQEQPRRHWYEKTQQMLSFIVSIGLLWLPGASVRYSNGGASVEVQHSH